MKIINNTDLTYEQIGMIIDKVINSNQGNTCYVGKLDSFYVATFNGSIKVQIRYMKKDVE